VTPTKLLIGQIIVVFAIVIAGIWFATEWAAWKLAWQPELGPPWFIIGDWPFYRPWAIFLWWYHFDAYAPHVFDRAGTIAGASGFVGCGAAIAGSLWRARQARHVTTYGSARWATVREVERARLHRDAGVFLGRLGHHYLRHDGPEHVMAFAYAVRQRRWLGRADIARLDRLGGHPRHQGRKLEPDGGLPVALLALPAVQPHRRGFRQIQSSA
jgi:type IV secretion system protein VirD4